MLTDERQMTESDGILIADPSRGLSYQLAGGFQRLGRRMVGVLKDSSDLARIKHVPMQTTLDASTASYKTLVLSLESNLGNNSVPLTEEFESTFAFLRDSLKIRPDRDVVWALPLATPEFQLQKLRDWSKSLSPTQLTVFLCPALFGFRDSALMSQALEFLKNSPASLWAPPATENVDLGFAGDLVSLIVSVPQSLAQGKWIKVPATTQSLSEWRKAFVKAFAPELGWPEPRPLTRLKSFLNARRLGQNLNFGASLSHPDLSPVPELFPVTMTSLERALDQCARAWRQSDMELIYPPSRGA